MSPGMQAEAQTAEAEKSAALRHAAAAGPVGRFCARHASELVTAAMVFWLVGGKVAATAYLEDYVSATAVVHVRRAPWRVAPPREQRCRRRLRGGGGAGGGAPHGSPVAPPSKAVVDGEARSAVVDGARARDAGADAAGAQAVVVHLLLLGAVVAGSGLLQRRAPPAVARGRRLAAAAARVGLLAARREGGAELHDRRSALPGERREHAVCTS